MGLDMYLTAEKRLSKRSSIDRQYIKYFNTIIDSSKNCEDGLLYAVYTNQSIYNELLNFPKLVGQVGNITTIKKDGDSYIVYTEAGYWRKANQIHNWFVEVCQDGVDECQKTMLESDQLFQLQYVIKAFGKLPSKRKLLSLMDSDRGLIISPEKQMLYEKLLPSISGFFFGSTAIDTYYVFDIVKTRTLLRKILKKSTINNWQFAYQSSW